MLKPYNAIYWAWILLPILPFVAGILILEVYYRPNFDQLGGLIGLSGHEHIGFQNT